MQKFIKKIVKSKQTVSELHCLWILHFLMSNASEAGNYSLLNFRNISKYFTGYLSGEKKLLIKQNLSLLDTARP